MWTFVQGPCMLVTGIFTGRNCSVQITDSHWRRPSHILPSHTRTQTPRKQFPIGTRFPCLKSHMKLLISGPENLTNCKTFFIVGCIYAASGLRGRQINGQAHVNADDDRGIKLRCRGDAFRRRRWRRINIRHRWRQPSAAAAAAAAY